MKKLLLTLAIATALLFCSCAKQNQLEAKQTQTQPETAVQKPAKIADSHVCGAKTLDGKTCTRKVADKNGEFCFQHRGTK